MNLCYLLFLSCSWAWKKHKLWYKSSDNFCYIVLFKLYSISELFTGLERAQALVKSYWWLLPCFVIYARAWTRRAPWYMPCAPTVCLVYRCFAACFNVSISWLGGGMHEACGLAHGQCTPCVAWPLLQASPVLDGVAQRRCMHTNSALMRYEIIIVYCK